MNEKSYCSEHSGVVTCIRDVKFLLRLVILALIVIFGGLFVQQRMTHGVITSVDKRMAVVEVKQEATTENIKEIKRDISKIERMNGG